MSDHIWVQESLDAYTAGGLTADERVTLERHLAGCAECTQALATARSLEATMKSLFADAPPDRNLEERAIHHLRRQPARSPMWVRYALSAAAVLVLGFLGAVAQTALNREGGTTFTNIGSKIGSATSQSSNNLKHLGLAMQDINPAATELDADANYQVGRIGDVSVPGAADPLQVFDSDFKTQMKWDESRDGIVPGSGRQAYSTWALPQEKYGGEGREQAKKVREMNGLFIENILAVPVSPGSSPTYYKPGETNKPVPTQTPPPPTKQEQPPTAKKLEEKQSGEKNEPPNKDDGPSNTLLLQQPEPPLEAARKIIRTGDIDFEVESFDTAAKGISNLISAIKGGFIATTNSDKLPNGKMRGAVVVRMPPQHLDKFIADLRGLLTGQNGELKSQRIGSQDVTKQYTDIESELRAARAVEGRLIEIIKTGKGEVKDLIAAERELGIWRTKIEKFEGEIRYYNNQVSLSTLTINLAEKEIQTPYALVTSETVQMRIEVENVTKALERATKAVEALKGRVLKSESKQHKAGQLEATLHAEIPPAQREAFVNELNKLGIVSENESNQKTLAEGGTGKPGNIPSKVKDVVFEVSLYNVVNIPPRNSVKLKVASSEVAASYAKLEAFVLAKGQMRVATLSEPDKQRATGYLEFNVPTDQKDAADKLIAAIGPVLDKANVQVPVTEIATNQKFGYVVNLYSVATIAPREKVVLKLEVDDVAARAAEVEMIAKASKGQAEKGRFVQSQQGQTSTTVVVHVPLSASDTLVSQFMRMGKVVERDQTPNPNAPENELATALIVVHLTGGSPIVPSDEGLWGQVRQGLYFAFWLLSKGLVFVIIGLCGVLPWVLVIWGGVKLCMWMFGGPQPASVVEQPATVIVQPAPSPENPTR